MSLFTGEIRDLLFTFVWSESFHSIKHFLTIRFRDIRMNLSFVRLKLIQLSNQMLFDSQLSNQMLFCIPIIHSLFDACRICKIKHMNVFFWWLEYSYLFTHILSDTVSIFPWVLFSNLVDFS